VELRKMICEGTFRGCVIGDCYHYGPHIFTDTFDVGCRPPCKYPRGILGSKCKRPFSVTKKPAVKEAPRE
jgi:hypothetical protein